MSDRDADPGLSAEADGPFFILSDRQRQILALAALGLTNREIARRLHLSVHTVPEYLKMIRERLGASNTTHAVALALVSELIEIPRDASQGCPPQVGGGNGGK